MNTTTPGRPFPRKDRRDGTPVFPAEYLPWDVATHRPVSPFRHSVVRIEIASGTGGRTTCYLSPQDALAFANDIIHAAGLTAASRSHDT